MGVKASGFSGSRRRVRQLAFEGREVARFRAEFARLAEGMQKVRGPEHLREMLDADTSLTPEVREECFKLMSKMLPTAEPEKTTTVTVTPSPYGPH